MRARLAFLACGVLCCVAVLGAFYGIGRPNVASSDEEKAIPARAGGVVAQASGGSAEVRAENVVVAGAGRVGAGARENYAGAVREGRAVLRVVGEPGTGFSGACTVGGEEREELAGEVPGRFAYDLDGGELGCEISNESGGRMRVVFVAGQSRVEQQTSAEGAKMQFRYSENGVSSSTSSSGSSGVVSQSSSSSVSSRSSTVVQSGD